MAAMELPLATVPDPEQLSVLTRGKGKYMHGRTTEHQKFATRIQACGQVKNLGAARKIEAEIRDSEFAINCYLKRLLMDAYADCGDVESVRRVFQSIPFRKRGISCWILMVKVLANNGHPEEARSVFDDIPDRWKPRPECLKNLNGRPMSTVAAINALMDAYRRSGNLEAAKDLFDAIPRKQRAASTSSHMMVAYAHSGMMLEAHKTFESIHTKSHFAWQQLMQAYLDNCDFMRAKDVYHRMPFRSAEVNTIMIKEHLIRGLIEEARSLFNGIRPDLLDGSAWTSMVQAYSLEGRFKEALSLFHMMPNRHIPRWNKMIAECGESGELTKAKAMFDSMSRREPLSWAAMLTAYAQNGHIEEARTMFSRMPSSNRDLVICNTMLDVFGKAGHVDEAEKLFTDMDDQDLSSWNAMIGGYAQSGHSQQAVHHFRLLDLSGLCPNKSSIINALQACTTIDTLAQGRILHAELLQAQAQDDEEEDQTLTLEAGNALIRMYGKCRSVVEARNVFDDMKVRSTWTWNIMLFSYAQAGHATEAVRLCEEMALDGTQPDRITFIALLEACGKARRTDLGCSIYTSAGDHFAEIDADLDLYVAMIHLLGRCGWLQQAEEFMSSIPYDPDVEELLAALKAYISCYGDQHKDFGQVFTSIKDPYVLLRKLYGDVERQGDAFEEALQRKEYLLQSTSNLPEENHL